MHLKLIILSSRWCMTSVLRNSSWGTWYLQELWLTSQELCESAVLGLIIKLSRTFHTLLSLTVSLCAVCHNCALLEEKIPTQLSLCRVDKMVETNQSLSFQFYELILSLVVVVVIWMNNCAIRQKRVLWPAWFCNMNATVQTVLFQCLQWLNK